MNNPENGDFDVIEEVEIDKLPVDNSDRDLVNRLIDHINQPCETKLPSGKTVNIRDFYIQEAKKILPTIVDKFEQKRLQDVIDYHEEQDTNLMKDTNR